MGNGNNDGEACDDTHIDGLTAELFTKNSYIVTVIGRK
jgi:hypothetical protein